MIDTKELVYHVTVCFDIASKREEEWQSKGKGLITTHLSYLLWSRSWITGRRVWHTSSVQMDLRSRITVNSSKSYWIELHSIFQEKKKRKIKEQHRISFGVKIGYSVAPSMTFKRSFFIVCCGKVERDNQKSIKRKQGSSRAKRPTLEEVQVLIHTRKRWAKIADEWRMRRKEELERIKVYSIWMWRKTFCRRHLIWETD